MKMAGTARHDGTSFFRSDSSRLSPGLSLISYDDGNAQLLQASVSTSVQWGHGRADVHTGVMGIQQSGNSVWHTVTLGPPVR